MMLRSAAVLGALCAAMASVAQAQAIPTHVHAEPSMLAGVSLEPELIVNAGYLQPLRPLAPGLQLTLGATLGWLVLLPPEAQLRGALIAALSYSIRPWRAQCVVDASLARFADDVGTKIGVGAGLRCQPTWLTRRWGLGLDLGIHSTLTTHIEHSARARRTFSDRYPNAEQPHDGPRDGFYAFTAQRIRLGLYAETALSAHYSAALALGTLFALQRQGIYFGFNLAQVPAYLELTVRASW